MDKSIKGKIRVRSDNKTIINEIKTTLKDRILAQKMFVFSLNTDRVL